MNKKEGNKGSRERIGGREEGGKKKRKKTDSTLKRPTIQQKDMKTNERTKML